MGAPYYHTPPINPQVADAVTVAARIMSATANKYPRSTFDATAHLAFFFWSFLRHIPFPSSFLFLTMALVRFFHILTVVSLAVLYTSFDALPVNALAVEHAHIGRGLGHAHADIAKKRGDSQKCRPRPTSASQSPAAATYQPTTTAPSSKYSQPAQSSSSSQPAPTNASPSTLSSKIMYAWSNNEQPSLANFVPSTAGTRLCVHSLIVSGSSSLTLSTQSLQLALDKIFRF